MSPQQLDGEIVVYGERHKVRGNNVSIVTNGVALSGWTSIRITRGAERCPSDFSIGATERLSDDMHAVIRAGDPFVLKIGDDVVVTGYVDTLAMTMEGDSHSVEVTGRGKCQDMVDSSAEWNGSQISGATVLGIAQKLAKPYGITVKLGDGVTEPGKAVPKIILNYGETAYSLIERLARFHALLAYEDENGALILDQVGTTEAASGITEGVNVERATMTFSMAQRYSIYRVYRMSVEQTADSGPSYAVLTSETDPGVLRHRQLDIVCEAGAAGQDLGYQRAQWEKARRYGRSFMLNVTVDTWRDSAGDLWKPNSLIPIDIPTLKIPAGSKWVIGEVTFRRGPDGTHADLVIMPPQAFQPEPILL